MGDQVIVLGFFPFITVSAKPRCGQSSRWWSVEEKSLLAKYWEEGLSAKQIAAAFKKENFSKSRNAILGQVHRLRLIPRESPIKSKNPKTMTQRSKYKLRKETLARLVVPEQQEQEVDAAAGTPQQGDAAPFGVWKGCQWIAGTPSPIDDCKCGKPRAGVLLPYCEEHQARVYQKR